MPGADLNHSQIAINPTVPDRAGYSKTSSTGCSRVINLVQTFLFMLIRTAVAERKQVHPCTGIYHNIYLCVQLSGVHFCLCSNTKMCRSREVHWAGDQDYVI